MVGETHDFYRVEADACMQALDVPAYLAHVQRRLDEENERIIHYLDAATRKAPHREQSKPKPHRSQSLSSQSLSTPPPVKTAPKHP